MNAIDLSGFWEKYKYKLPIALAVVGVVLIIGGLFLSSNSKQTDKQADSFPKESLLKNQKITVDVSGAVNNPGVYQLNNGSRVEDAIKAARGFSDQANPGYVSKSLNMAQKLSDGSKIYVPFVGEQTGGVVGGSVAGASTQGSVNLNSGTQAELEGLPGIGPVTAGKIISGRPYQKIQDLLDQKVVSKTVFDKIKDSLTL